MRSGIIIIAGFLFLFTNCKKDETEDFSYCTGCPIEEWVGDFAGKGTYFKASTGTTQEDIDVTLKVKITSGDNLSFNILAPNYFSQVFYGSKDNDQHYIQIAGTAKSLDLNLYKKVTEYKITGTAKTYKTPADGGTVIDETLTFRVFTESE